jgi:hypothetical protein
MAVVLAAAAADTEVVPQVLAAAVTTAAPVETLVRTSCLRRGLAHMSVQHRAQLCLRMHHGQQTQLPQQFHPQ